jgi:hypothetical protein
MLQEKVAHIPNHFADGVNVSSNMRNYKRVTERERERERDLEGPWLETHIGVEFQVIIAA